MARPRKPPTTQARIAVFAHDELGVLVDNLYTDADFDTNAVTVLGALVLAARQLPPEVVAALVPAYVRREKEVMAAPPPGP